MKDLPPVARWRPDAFRTEGPSRVQLIASRIARILSALFLVGMALYFYLVSKSFHAFPPFLIPGVPMILMSIAGSFSAESFESETVANERDAALLEETGIPQWLVAIKTNVATLPKAYDRGVLTIDEGVLIFVGRSCSFLIGSQDLTQRCREGMTGGWWRNAHLELNGDRRTILIIQPLSGKPRRTITNGKPGRADSQRALGKALVEFAACPPTGERRSYPPMTGSPKPIFIHVAGGG